jgi:hypothetical protein
MLPHPIHIAKDRREEICANAWTVKHRAYRRAQFVEDQKVRLYLRIPYHEWAEALARGKDAIGDLLAAYAPPYSGICKRCPPWASRRYREASMPVEYFQGSPVESLARALSAHRATLAPKLAPPAFLVASYGKIRAREGEIVRHG